MNEVTWLQLAVAIVTPLASAFAAYKGRDVKIEWLRRDVDKAHARLDRHDEQISELYR